jgi:Ca-activated chloride channel family protein
LALADGMVLPQGLMPGYWVVREHHVTVTIEGQHAITRVEQEFANPTDSEVTGRYLFPIPPGAAVTGFTVEVNGEARPVIHQDAATTNSALQAAITAQRDPSLLRYADWESLAFDLTLPARGTQRMTLRYEEALQAAGGMFHYRYTLSTERYSATPLEAVSIKVALAHQAGLASIYSPSHAISVARSSATEAEVLWEAENVVPTEDFELAFAPAEGGFGGGFLTGERNGQGHFLFTFAPELHSAEKDVLPKDIIFVIDRSGSMSGEKIIQAQNALQFILGQLYENDRFAIVGFDDQLELSADTLEPVNRESLARARRFVGRLDARGSTDIDLALHTGLDILKRSEARPGATRLLVFLTDGLPTAGITGENEIVNRANDANRSVEARLTSSRGPTM